MRAVMAAPGASSRTPRHPAVFAL